MEVIYDVCVCAVSDRVESIVYSFLCSLNIAVDRRMAFQLPTEDMEYCSSRLNFDGDKWKMIIIRALNQTN